MEDDRFETNVFLNCPFDEDYEPLLQAVLFCLVYLGFTPRLATESVDSGAVRLARITELIRASRYSIHDLSRCQAAAPGEHFRLNMPFELGVDHGCRIFGGGAFASKKVLILEEQRYRYQVAISDLAGCDIEAHAGDFQIAVRKVRNWLVSEAGARNVGAAAILGGYADFQEWYFERQLNAGFSEDDIRDYPTAELLGAMKDWVDLGMPR